MCAQGEGSSNITKKDVAWSGLTLLLYEQNKINVDTVHSCDCGPDFLEGTIVFG